MSQFKYVKSGETKVGEKRMEILSVVNAGGKELKERFTERGIKIPEITRIRMSTHNQIDAETNAIKSEARKFFLKLKNGKSAIINFSKFF